MLLENNQKGRFDDILCILSEDFIDRREEARKSFKAFVQFIKGDKYDMTDFHEAAIADLENFVKKQYASRMMLFAPPQHGKSELSSRLLPAYLLGVNPSLKLVIVCYAKVIAEGFSSDVQSIIASPEYRQLFPNTIIDGVGCKKGTLKRNSYEFRTSEDGYLISVGVGGPLTSKTIDIAIIDDVYKGPLDAYSSLYRSRVESWYWKVLETRLHNNSKVLILYTRWHEDDLAGNIIKAESELWKQVKYEAIKTKKTADNLLDKRKVGEPLWAERHSLEKLERWKARDPIGFEALGQQNPQPAEGKMYPRHRVYQELPNFDALEMFYIRKGQIDTADDGNDYLAAVTYIESGGLCYITDIYYTQEPMEVTEEMTADMLYRNKTEFVLCESNSGGKGFARNVQKILDSRYENHNCYIEWFHQSDNKESKIFSNAAKVMNRVLFPADWEKRWPEAYESFTKYLRKGKNEHDDLQDVLSEIVSRIETEPDEDLDDVMVV